MKQKQNDLQRFLFITLFLLFGCDTKSSGSAADIQLHLILERPSLLMLGDSISSFWPEELLEPFRVSKAAFPNRNTQQILTAAENLEGRYRSCTYNGGANDYLGILTPVENERIEETIRRQKEAITLLKMRCDSIVVIGFWNVEAPWPIAAVRQLNDKMHSSIADEFILDPMSEVTPDMLMDGGHLTYRGYQAVSPLVLEAFRLKGIIIQ
ncbi:SGNH/GDSL hydrolase family protein [Leptospira yasudae]|uniref:SGNH/GDSL hydrolase family protein n=1 Tax=Leptospira yasudae TaxID=2202201 RepID=UPI0010914785|nr:SGNH/GDSL hydrolase family protein [Leptospira yasudae]MBW0435948.1 SGNH/GDSL hydrolase family protein [Leptospira yasudae]TGM96921.1 SGNH/GDSL hydrolase family protein [Leptospira yasudae]